MRVPEDVREQIVEAAKRQDRRRIVDLAYDLHVRKASDPTTTNHGLLKDAVDMAFEDPANIQRGDVGNYLDSLFGLAVGKVSQMRFGDAMLSEMFMMEDSIDFQLAGDVAMIVADVVNPSGRTVADHPKPSVRNRQEHIARTGGDGKRFADILAQSRNRRKSKNRRY